jgi:hypothetical protein
MSIAAIVFAGGRGSPLWAVARSPLPQLASAPAIALQWPGPVRPNSLLPPQITTACPGPPESITQLVVRNARRGFARRACPDAVAGFALELLFLPQIPRACP